MKEKGLKNLKCLFLLLPKTANGEKVTRWCEHELVHNPNSWLRSFPGDVGRMQGTMQSAEVHMLSGLMHIDFSSNCAEQEKHKKPLLALHFLQWPLWTGLT
jgi:hypothetical protein